MAWRDLYVVQAYRVEFIFSIIITSQNKRASGLVAGLIFTGPYQHFKQNTGHTWYIITLKTSEISCR